MSDVKKDDVGEKGERGFVDLGALWSHDKSTKSKPIWGGKFQLEEIMGLYEVAGLPLPSVLYFNMFPVENREHKKQPVLRLSARKPEPIDDEVGDVPTGLELDGDDG